MSRVGKNPVAIPEGVELFIEGKKLLIKGKQGSLSMHISDRIELQPSEKQIEVKTIFCKRLTIMSVNNGEFLWLCLIYFHQAV